MGQPLIPDCGVQLATATLIKQIQGGGLSSQVEFFSNPGPPLTRATVYGDLTLVAAGGLTAKPLPVPTDGGVNLYHRDIWTFPTINFTATGAGLPVVGYGYAVSYLHPFTGVRTLFWVQRFDTFFTWVNAGDNYPLNLSFGGNQC